MESSLLLNERLQNGSVAKGCYLPYAVEEQLFMRLINL